MKNLNTKILGVALIPVYCYVLLSVFAFVRSGFEWSVFDPWIALSLVLAMSLSALCFSLQKHFLHIIGLLILLCIGALVIYAGFQGGIHTLELIMAALLIAFACSMYEFVHKRM